MNHSSKRQITMTAIIGGLLLLFVINVQAAEVLKVKNNKAIVKLDEPEVPVGQEYFALDSSGKKRAILKVTQSKNGKAIVEIIKGKVEVGYTTKPKEASSISAAAAEEDTAPSFTKTYTGNSWGILGSMTQTTMNVSIPTSTTDPTITTVGMTGSNFGVVGFYDYGYQPNLIIRGVSGYEQLLANGTSSSSSCNNSANCTFNVSYLSMYGVIRYNFMSNQWKPWIGGTYGFLFALSKTSNVIDTGGISMNQIYGFNTGFDIPLNRKSYIPVTLEYDLFPSSSSVSANFLTIRAGYAWYL